jgi:hypothetical protein
VHLIIGKKTTKIGKDTTAAGILTSIHRRFKLPAPRNAPTPTRNTPAAKSVANASPAAAGGTLSFHTGCDGSASSNALETPFATHHKIGATAISRRDQDTFLYMINQKGHP